MSVANTDFDSVMSVQTNVLSALFDRIFTPNIASSDSMQIRNIVDYGLWCIIHLHNFDLKSIEQEIKDINLYADKTKGAMGKQMKKFRMMMQACLNQQGNTDSVIERIRERIRDRLKE